MELVGKLKLLIEDFFSFNRIFEFYIREDLHFLILTSSNEVVIYKNKGQFDYKFEKFQTIPGFQYIKSIPEFIMDGPMAFTVLDDSGLHSCYLNEDRTRFIKKNWKSGKIFRYAYNNDDCYVVVEDRDLRFNLFAKNFVKPERKNAHESNIYAVDYYFGRVATGDLNGTIKVWDQFADNCLNEYYHAFDNTIFYLKFIDNNKQLIASDEYSIKIFNLVDNSIKVNIPRCPATIRNIEVFHKKEPLLLFVTYRNGALKVFDINTGNLYKEYQNFTFKNKAIDICNLWYKNMAILSKNGVFLQKFYVD